MKLQRHEMGGHIEKHTKTWNGRPYRKTCNV